MSSTARPTGAPPASPRDRRRPRRHPQAPSRTPAASADGGAGAVTPSSLYSARQYSGSHDCSSNGISSGFAVSAATDLAAQRTFVGDETQPRTLRQCRPEIGELVPLGDDLGQRTDREPAAVLVEHLCRPLGGSPQREPIFGERRDRPELPTGCQCSATAIAQLEQRGPVGICAHGVDHSHQAVEVGAVDQVVDVAQTIGHGYRRPD